MISKATFLFSPPIHQASPHRTCSKISLVGASVVKVANVPAQPTSNPEFVPVMAGSRLKRYALTHVDVNPTGDRLQCPILQRYHDTVQASLQRIDPATPPPRTPAPRTHIIATDENGNSHIVRRIFIRR